MIPVYLLLLSHRCRQGEPPRRWMPLPWPWPPSPQRPLPRPVTMPSPLPQTPTSLPTRVVQSALRDDMNTILIHSSRQRNKARTRKQNPKITGILKLITLLRAFQEYSSLPRPTCPIYDMTSLFVKDKAKSVVMVFLFVLLYVWCCQVLLQHGGSLLFSSGAVPSVTA